MPEKMPEVQKAGNGVGAYYNQMGAALDLVPQKRSWGDSNNTKPPPSRGEQARVENAGVGQG